MTLRRIAAIILAVPAAALAYVAVAAFSVIMPTLAERVGADERTKTVWIISNGVHTDIVLKAADLPRDWRKLLPRHFFSADIPAPSHLGFGWGARALYLEAPTWAHLTFATAIRAMSWDRTFNHVALYARLPDAEHRRALALTPDQTSRLWAYIQSRFAIDPEGHGEFAAFGYRGNDAFFAATGHYSPLITCNQWTSAALRAAGQQVATWAPFAQSILWSLSAEEERRDETSPRP